MILLEPKFVNTEFKIYFGSRNDEYKDDESFLIRYLKDIHRITEIDKFVLMKQIHSDNIEQIKEPVFTKAESGIFYRVIKQTDGIYTTKSNIALCVKTADCMPVFVIAKDIIAAIHMGWRGAQSLIIRKYLKTILSERKISPQDIFIIAGPHIRDCCYEVGDDLIPLFEKTYEKTYRIFIKRNTRLFLSLENALRVQAGEMSVPDKNIHCMKICTHCANMLFHSYRYEKLNHKRNISFISKVK